jgi:hypothetical protein
MTALTLLRAQTVLPLLLIVCRLKTPTNEPQGMFAALFHFSPLLTGLRQALAEPGQDTGLPEANLDAGTTDQVKAARVATGSRAKTPQAEADTAAVIEADTQPAAAASQRLDGT